MNAQTQWHRSTPDLVFSRVRARCVVRVAIADRFQPVARGGGVTLTGVRVALARAGLSALTLGRGARAVSPGRRRGVGWDSLRL